jgi:membrane-associated phospholipid phosphatase
MKCDSRIVSDLALCYQPYKALNRRIFGIWVLGGLLCLVVDNQLQPLLQSWGNSPAVGWTARYWCELGASWGITAFVVAGFVSTIRHRDKTLLEIALSVSLAGVAAQLIKHAVGRVRPDSLSAATHFYGPLAWFRVEHAVRIDSFPSGHTTAAFAMALALSLRWPRWSGLWIVLASGVGVSRTLTNSHYLSDVVFGALLGTMVSLSTHHFLRRENL